MTDYYGEQSPTPSRRPRPPRMRPPRKKPRGRGDTAQRVLEYLLKKKERQDPLESLRGTPLLPNQKNKTIDGVLNVIPDMEPDPEVDTEYSDTRGPSSADDLMEGDFRMIPRREADEIPVDVASAPRGEEKKLRPPNWKERLKIKTLKNTHPGEAQRYMERRGINPDFDEMEGVTFQDWVIDPLDEILRGGADIIGGTAGGLLASPAGPLGAVAGASAGAGVGRGLLQSAINLGLPLFDKNLNLGTQGIGGEMARGAVGTAALGTGRIPGLVQHGLGGLWRVFNRLTGRPSSEVVKHLSKIGTQERLKQGLKTDFGEKGIDKTGTIKELVEKAGVSAEKADKKAMDEILKNLRMKRGKYSRQDLGLTEKELKSLADDPNVGAVTLLNKMNRSLDTMQKKAYGESPAVKKFPFKLADWNEGLNKRQRAINRQENLISETLAKKMGKVKETKDQLRMARDMGLPPGRGKGTLGPYQTKVKNAENAAAEYRKGIPKRQAEKRADFNQWEKKRPKAPKQMTDTRRAVPPERAAELLHWARGVLDGDPGSALARENIEKTTKKLGEKLTEDFPALPGLWKNKEETEGVLNILRKANEGRPLRKVLRGKSGEQTAEAVTPKLRENIYGGLKKKAANPGDQSPVAQAFQKALDDVGMGKEANRALKDVAAIDYLTGQKTPLSSGGGDISLGSIGYGGALNNAIRVLQQYYDTATRAAHRVKSGHRSPLGERNLEDWVYQRDMPGVYGGFEGLLREVLKKRLPKETTKRTVDVLLGPTEVKRKKKGEK